MHNNLHQRSTYYVHRTGESNANFKQKAGEDASQDRGISEKLSFQIGLWVSLK
jgi:hypothetical protein